MTIEELLAKNKEKCKELLAQAKNIYAAGCIPYRDALLTTGMLIHEFILEYLKQGDYLKQDARLAREITRTNAIAQVTTALDMKRDTVGKLVSTAMTANLLGDGDLKIAGHKIIYHCSVFVQRKTHPESSYDGPNNPPISDCETWEIKPEFEASGKALFKRIVNGKFTRDQARAEINKLYHSAYKKPERKQKPFAKTSAARFIETPKPLSKGYTAPPPGKGGHPLQVLCAAGVKDAASSVAEAITRHPDPNGLCLALLRELAKSNMLSMDTRNRIKEILLVAA